VGGNGVNGGRRIVACALISFAALVLIAVVSPALAQGWIAYAPSGAGFQVSFPAAPETAKQVMQPTAKQIEDQSDRAASDEGIRLGSIIGTIVGALLLTGCIYEAWNTSGVKRRWLVGFAIFLGLGTLNGLTKLPGELAKPPPAELKPTEFNLARLLYRNNTRQLMAVYSERRSAEQRPEVVAAELAGVEAGLLHSTNGRLVRQSDISLVGVPGRETVVITDKGLTIVDRTYVGKAHTYTFSAVGMKGVEDDPDVAKFFGSIAFEPEGETR
jgi:MFS family permease